MSRVIHRRVTLGEIRTGYDRCVAEGIRRIVILTADVGEGHVAAARVLAADLRAEAPGIEIETIDALQALGPILRIVLKDAYRLQLLRLPSSFGLLFGLFLRARALRALGRGGLALFGARRLKRTLEGLRPDLVVSTYPAATSVVGTLRRRGHLPVPTCATITDYAGIPFWSHAGIDLHLVMHPSLIPLVEQEAGMNAARLVAPLTDRAFRLPPERQSARVALAIPKDHRVVVVSGGGWGVGDLAGAVAHAARIPATTVVCLAGRNDVLLRKLEASFADIGHVRVLGFTDEMPRLLAAADVLVHTTGGVTCLEALTVGCPIVAFGPPAGHSPALARAMASLGIATYARTAGELRTALLAPLAPPRPFAAETAATALLTTKIRTAPRSSTGTWVGRLAVLAAAGSAVFLAAGSHTAFALVASPLELGPRSVLPTRRPDVGLVVESAPRNVPRVAELLADRNETASFLFIGQPPARLRRLLGTEHDQLIGALGASGVDDWLGTADQIRDSRPQRYVLAPRGGVSTGQYVLARLAGARIVSAATQVQRGAVLVCDVRSLETTLAALHRLGLKAESVGALGTT
jgi:UDP-N-acetylglucosamine:LPS N-acetylglucosamine transferase